MNVLLCSKSEFDTECVLVCVIRIGEVELLSMAVCFQQCVDTGVVSLMNER